MKILMLSAVGCNDCRVYALASLVDLHNDRAQCESQFLCLLLKFVALDGTMFGMPSRGLAINVKCA